MQASRSIGAAVVLAAQLVVTPVFAQTTNTPDPPPHTGIRAALATTARDFLEFPQRPSTWMILGIGGAAAAVAHQADADTNRRLAGGRATQRFFEPGKWAGAATVQISTAAGLYAVGRWIVSPAADGSKTNKVSHLGFDLLRAQLMSQALVRGIKSTVRRDRPTGDCCSFPSGHAVNAFAAASVIERHLGARAAWPTLAVATYVGASRLHENRHYLSDVLFGAAVGTAIGWTVVGRHGRADYAVVPVPVRGGMAAVITRLR